MVDMERDVGRLEARMEVVEVELQGLRRDVREIRDALVSAKGGWMVLTIAISLAAAVGAFASSYLHVVLRSGQ
jgi:chromosome condensin MukBEF ATPase and DNA-binding subunit MukB